MITISLNRLDPAKGNVRKTAGNGGIEELAASTAAPGLFTSLDVRKATRGSYTVIAGQQRYRALKLLAKRGQLAPDHSRPASCWSVTLTSSKSASPRTSCVDNSLLDRGPPASSPHSANPATDRTLEKRGG